jgi:hypothetical protein
MAAKPRSGRTPAGLLDFVDQAKKSIFGAVKDTPAPRSMPDPRYKMLSQLTPAKLEQINKMVDDVTAAENVNILRDPAELAKVVAQFENLPQMQRSRELSEMDRELLLRRADRKASPDYLTPLKEFANMSYGTKFDIQPKEEPAILQDAAGYSAAQRRQAGSDIDSLAKIFQTGSMGKLTTTKGGEFGETYTAEDPEKKKKDSMISEGQNPITQFEEKFSKRAEPHVAAASGLINLYGSFARLQNASLKNPDEVPSYILNAPAQQVKTAIARWAGEKGNLAEGDIQRSDPYSKALLVRVNRGLKAYREGSIVTNDDVQAFRLIVPMLASASLSNLESLKADFMAQIDGGVYNYGVGINKQKAEALINSYINTGANKIKGLDALPVPPPGKKNLLERAQDRLEGKKKPRAGKVPTDEEINKMTDAQLQEYLGRQ